MLWYVLARGSICGSCVGCPHGSGHRFALRLGSETESRQRVEIVNPDGGNVTGPQEDAINSWNLRIWAPFWKNHYLPSRIMASGSSCFHLWGFQPTNPTSKPPLEMRYRQFHVPTMNSWASSFETDISTAIWFAYQDWHQRRACRSQFVSARKGWAYAACWAWQVKEWHFPFPFPCRLSWGIHLSMPIDHEVVPVYVYPLPIWYKYTNLLQVHFLTSILQVYPSHCPLSLWVGRAAEGWNLPWPASQETPDEQKGSNFRDFKHTSLDMVDTHPQHGDVLCGFLKARYRWAVATLRELQRLSLGDLVVEMTGWDGHGRRVFFLSTWKLMDIMNKTSC